MDLKNNQITVGELLSNPKAMAVFKREFPQIVNSPMVNMARGWTLAEVLHRTRQYLPPNKANQLLAELRSI